MMQETKAVPAGFQMGAGAGKEKVGKIQMNSINRDGKKRNRNVIEILTESHNGTVNKIHNAFVYQPKVCFQGGSVKWHVDKIKSACQ